MLVPFTLWRDLEDAAVRMAWQDQVVVLRAGEWSDWYPIEFEMIPYLATIQAECRFFLKQVHPHVQLYVSPFNFDPLDGSSNVDANVSIGTIFSIHRRVSPGDGPGELRDCMQAGDQQVCAGYIVYGSSTMLVYTTGAGVHGFTLEPSIGEFLLSHPNMKIPDPGQRIYSVNEAYYKRWSRGQQKAVDQLKEEGYSLR